MARYVFCAFVFLYGQKFAVVAKVLILNLNYNQHGSTHTHTQRSYQASMVIKKKIDLKWYAKNQKVNTHTQTDPIRQAW